MAARPRVGDVAQPGVILLVVHDFVARSEDELTLAKGDRIELIERDDEYGDGWFLGRHMANWRHGLFPQVYTTPAPRGTLTYPQRRATDVPPKTPQNSDDPPATSPTQQRHSSTSTMSTQQSAASPMAQMALRTSMPSGTTAPPSAAINADSPVMSETLSVIDEHMNNMSKPSSFTNGSKRDVSDSGSAYSAQPLPRYSYIAGHETDEEEYQMHTEAEVLAWGPERVAEYLEDQGVEKSHCEMFKEQEISGEVLLAMEQSSIFLKEFDLGSVGRRLKTWHKVRALQDEVRQNAPPQVPRSNSEYSVAADENEPSRNRSSTVGSVLPRALDTSRQSGIAPGRNNTVQSFSQSTAAPGAARPSAVSPLQSMTSMLRSDNTYRPSAQTIRQMQHSRRHSSIDSTSTTGNATRTGHRKQPSLDQKWQLGQVQTNGSSAKTGHSHTLSSESAFPERNSSLMSPSSPYEMDRGYFSSTELDNRSRPKNVLKKGASTTTSPMHSRTSSFAHQKGRRSTQSGRVASGDSPTIAQGVFGALSFVGNTFGTIRAVGSNLPRSNSQQDILSPIVTKLDYSSNPSSDALSTTQNTAGADGPPSRMGWSPSSNKIPFFSSNKPKATGLRSISDAVIKTEKSTTSPLMETSPARAGASTPSTETTSIDLQKSEAQSRTSQGSQGNSLPLPPTMQRRMRARTKTKKATSAYTRGLQKLTPAEQMAHCDYSGWMKKKSGSLMTTWKTRLFVLKGRRLSYYYADSDTEEKGLIDISFHRVLPATNETLTGLHATFTGAAGSPASPKETSMPTAAQQDLKESPAPADDDGIFIFKLVPPKSGLSKGVTFTKPTVHYFAVNSRQEGRLWMAALMKATIDRDEDGMVTTTYNQKTITLAKARARRERPPALREDAEPPAELDGGDERSSNGLGISENNVTVTGAENEKVREDDGAMVASTPATQEESEGLDEKEQLGIALNASS